MLKGTFSGRGTSDFRGTFVQKGTSGQAFYWAALGMPHLAAIFY